MSNVDHRSLGRPEVLLEPEWVLLPDGPARDHAVLVRGGVLAALESLRGGFTTVCDAGTRMAADVGVVAEAARDAGIRCVLGMVCNDLGPDGTAEPHDDVMAKAQAHLERWSGRRLVHPSLAVSIPEAATRETLAAVSRLCRERGAVFQTHVNEHLAAIERSLERAGRRPLEGLYEDGVLGPQCLLAHVTLVTAREVTMLRDTGTAVSYNPVASSWKGNAVAPALTFAAQGVRFGIGTDGTRGDAFRLMDAAETAQRLAYGLEAGDSSCGGGWTWLEHASTAGADAAGLAGVTGTIAEGLRADYLLVDLAVPEMQPSWDLEWELVRLANRDQIVAVVVDGQPRLWRGWPVDWDARQLVEEARRRAQKVVADAPVRIVHPTATEHRRTNAASRTDGRR